MQMEEQKFKTEEIGNSSDPIYNEIGTFDIVTGKERLEVIVMNWSDFGADTIIGKVYIDIGNLYDQTKHEDLYNLSGDSG